MYGTPCQGSVRRPPPTIHLHLIPGSSSHTFVILRRPRPASVRSRPSTTENHSHFINPKCAPIVLALPLPAPLAAPPHLSLSRPPAQSSRASGAVAKSSGSQRRTYRSLASASVGTRRLKVGCTMDGRV